MMENKKNIAVIVTSVLMVKFFLVPHLKEMAKIYDVTLILKNDAPEILQSMDLPVKIIVIPIERKINFIKDIYVLFLLAKIIKNESFDLVHTLTPKAGLLGTVAAWMNQVPVRIHTFQGEVWANKKGFWRFVLRSLDKLVAKLTTNILVVSESERQYLITEKIISPGKSCVLGSGSISGVDFLRFKQDDTKRELLRKELFLDQKDILFIYVGRMNVDKGLLDLAEAFHLLAAEIPNVYLHMIGPDEEDIISKLSVIKQAVENRLRFMPYTDQPELAMLPADVLVLPSYREGFGVVVIEAAALCIPAIGSKIYGIIDAIEDNLTGKLFEKGNVLDLYEQMKVLACSDDLRIRMGKEAYNRVKRDFVQDDLVSQTINFYSTLLAT